MMRALIGLLLLAPAALAQTLPPALNPNNVRPGYNVGMPQTSGQITPAGTNQLTAAALPYATNILNACAPNTGVLLPAAAAGPIDVVNSCDTISDVYPFGTQTLTLIGSPAGAPGAPIPLPVGGYATFYQAATGNWIVIEASSADAADIATAEANAQSALTAVTGLSASVGQPGGIAPLDSLGTISTQTVLPQWGTTPVPLSSAVSVGQLDLVRDFGSPHDFHTGTAIVGGTAGGTALSIPGAAFVTADVGKTIRLDYLGATPTTGPVTSIPVATSGSGYGLVWPSVALANAGSGSGNVANPVMVADSITWGWRAPVTTANANNHGAAIFGPVTQLAGEQSGTYTIAWTSETSFSVTAPDGTVLPAGTNGVAYATQIGFTVTEGHLKLQAGDSATIALAQALPTGCPEPQTGIGTWTIDSGHVPTVIQAPLTAGAVAPGALITILKAGTWMTPPSTQTLSLYGAGCSGLGQVLVTWKVDHIRETIQGINYPAGTTASLSGGSPSTPATLGTPVETPVAQPLVGTIAAVTDATHIVLSTPILTPPPATAIEYVYGHPDTAAVNAAFAAANALTRQGQYPCIYMPASIWTIGPLTPLLGDGCFQSQAPSLAMTWLIDPSVAGPVLDFDNATRLYTNTPNGPIVGSVLAGSSVDVSHKLTGAQLAHVTFVGDRDAVGAQYAITFADEGEYFGIDGVDCYMIKGACIRTGVNDAFPGKKPFLNEGHIFKLRTYEVGDLDTGTPAVDARGELNQWQVVDYQCFNAYYACWWIHDAGAPNPSAQVKIEGFRGEYTQGGDTVILGGAGEAGAVQGITFLSPILTSVATDFAGIHLLPSADTPSSPSHIVVTMGQNIGGATSGPVIVADAGSSNTFLFPSGMQGAGAFNFVLNAGVSGLITLDDDQHSSYDYAIDPAVQQAGNVQWPVYLTGDPQHPALNLTALPGALSATTITGDVSQATVVPTGGSAETLAQAIASGSTSVAGVASIAGLTGPVTDAQLAAALIGTTSGTFAGGDVAAANTAAISAETTRAQGVEAQKVPLAGGPMSGALALAAGSTAPTPIASAQVANKSYVDAAAAAAPGAVASVSGQTGTVTTGQLYTALKGSLGTSGTLADAGDVQTAITGLSSTYITSSQSTAAISTALMGYVSGSQNDVTSAKVIAQYGTQGMSEAQAASLGLLDIRAYGGVSDFQSGYTVVAGTKGSTTISVATAGQAGGPAAFVHGVDDAADVFGHTKRISIDGGGAQPTSGPIAADPTSGFALITVSNPGLYDQSGFPEPLLSNTGGGAGAVLETVWQVVQAQLTVAPAGCTSTTGLFYIVGGEIPTFVQMTPNGTGGMTQTVGTNLTISTAGTFIDQIQGGNAHVFRLASNDNSYCQTPGQVQLEFGLNHVSIRNQAGGGYPATGTIGADGAYPSAVVASLSGGGTPLTAATLGTVDVQIWTPPLNTSITNVVNATTITVSNPLGSTLPFTNSAYRWAHDDLPAFQAAAAVANTPGSAGGASRPIYMPPGVWYTTGAIPPFTNSGGLRGAGLLKTLIFAEPSSSYDVDSCDNNSLFTVPSSWNVTSFNLSKQVTGCDLQDFTVTSDLSSAFRINANVLAGRNYFVQAGNLGAAYLPGSGFSTGAVYNGEAASGTGESSFGYMWFRADGAWRQGGGSCTLDLDSRGAGYVDNELHFDRNVRIYDPQGAGACIYNDQTNGSSVSPIDIHGLFVEGQAGSAGNLPRVPANLFEIGNQVSTGKVGEVHITSLGTYTISPDFAGMKINCPTTAGFGSIHNHVVVDFQQTDKASNGPPLDLECIRFGQFNFAGNDAGGGFDFKVGPSGTVSGAKRVNEDGIYTDGNYTYTLSTDSTSEQAIYGQVETTGSPANPAGNVTDIPGTTITDTLQVRGCNGYMYATGASGNVTCAASTSSGGSIPDAYAGLWASGTWHGPVFNSTGSASCAPTALRQYAVPIFVPGGTVLKKEAVQITTSNTSGAVNLRMLLFDATGVGSTPGATLEDSGVIALAANTATGSEIVTFPSTYTTPADGIVWASLISDSAGIGLSCVSASAPGAMANFIGSATAAGVLSVLAPTGLYATTAPGSISAAIATFGPESTVQGSSTPAVALGN
jgi:hypothetical protein